MDAAEPIKNSLEEGDGEEDVPEGGKTSQSLRSCIGAAAGKTKTGQGRVTGGSLHRRCTSVLVCSVCTVVSNACGYLDDQTPVLTPTLLLSMDPEACDTCTTCLRGTDD